MTILSIIPPDTTYVFNVGNDLVICEIVLSTSDK